MRWRRLTGITALTCLIPSKLPEFVSVMTNLCSLEVKYKEKKNNSQQDRLKIQRLTRLTSLVLNEDPQW